MMLSKEKQLHVNFRDTVTSALQALHDYHGPGANNPLDNKVGNLGFVVDVMEGLLCMINGDWQGLKPLVVKLGGFPDQIEKLDQFLKLVKDNKEGISFKSATALVKANSKAIIEKLPIASLVGGNDKLAELIKQGMEDPASLFDPKTLFNHFANSRGAMGFEEFNNVFVQLNLKINHARMLQIFSAADIEKRGELRYQDFKRTLEHLKNFLIHEIME